MKRSISEIDAAYIAGTLATSKHKCTLLALRDEAVLHIANDDMCTLEWNSKDSTTRLSTKFREYKKTRVNLGKILKLVKTIFI